MEVGQKIGELAMKHVKEMALEIVDQVLIVALEEAVVKSATPLDDLAIAALKEPLKAALKEAIEKM